jgi:hypothetical protein
LAIRIRLIHSPLPSKVSLVGLVGCLYVSWIIYGGVRPQEAISSFAVLSLQVVIGQLVVQRISQFRLSSLETIAIGFAVGSIVCTLLDQVLLLMRLDLSIWVVQGVLLVVLILVAKGTHIRLLPQPQVFDFRLALATPTLVMSGYGVFARGWWLAIAVNMSVLGATFLPVIARSLRKTVAVAFAGLVAWAFLLFLSRPVAPIYGDWLLRPLYTGSDDLVFSESMSWSLSHFGISDYAAAINTSVRYHWFSLAWSGLVQKSSGVAPFVTTLHVVPVVAFAIITWLVVALARLAPGRSRGGIIAVITLFGTAISIEPHRMYHVLNTSNIAPFIWLLLLPIALILNDSENLRSRFIVLPVLTFVAFVAKAPFGVAALCGVSSSLTIGGFRRRNSSQLVLLVLVGLISLVTYSSFLSPHDWERRHYSITWNFADLLSGSRYYPLAPLFLIAVVIATVFVGVLGLRRVDLTAKLLIALAFLVGASSVGLLRFIVSGGSAELYFFNVTIFCGAIVTGLAIDRGGDESDSPHQLTLFVAIAISFICMMVEIHLKVVSRITSPQISHIISPLSIALLLLCVMFGLQKVVGRQIVGSRSVFLAFATLAASTALLMNLLEEPEDYLSTTQVASIEDVAALSWLRNSSPSTAIVATNRFLCITEQPCSFDDSSYLISAVARRRVLVEGPRFVIGGRPYPDWIKQRIELSVRFANSPNQADLDTLRRYGVSWFVIDERFLESGAFDESSWANFGNVRYHLGAVAIVELWSS